MVRKIYIFMAALVVAVVLLTACQKSEKDKNGTNEEISETGNPSDIEGDLTKGYIEEGTYVNPYFELEITLPEGWVELTEEQQADLMSAGQDIVEEQDIEVNIKDLAILNLFAVFKYPLEEQRSVNPNIVASAEKLEPESDIDSATGYLEVTKTLMISMGVPLEFSEDIEEVQIGGQTYAKLSASIETDMAVIKQVYYTRVVEGYALNIIGTYTEEDGKEVIESILE